MIRCLTTTLLLLLGCAPAQPEPPPPSAPPAPVTAAELTEQLRAEGHDISLLSTSPMPHAGPLERYRLGSGLEIVYQRDAAAPVVAFQTWLRVGSADEPASRQGLAHMLEHLMFRNAGGLGDGAFDRRLEALGIETNAVTWFDFTMYDEVVPKDTLATVIELEARRLHTLGEVSAEILEAERQVVASEREWRVDDDPQGVLLERVYTAEFGDHPYGRLTVGSPEAIAAISEDDCRDFFARYYRPERAALVLVGDVEREALLRLILEHYGARFPGPAKPVSIERPPLPRRDTVVSSNWVRMPIAVELLLLAYRGPPMRASDALVMEVIVQLLFASPTGLVYRELKDESGLASSVLGSWNPMRETSVLEVQVVFSPGVEATQGRDLIRAIIERILAVGLDEKTFELARSRTELLYVRDIQDPRRRAEWLGTYWALADKPELIMERLEAVRELESQDVVRVMGLYLAGQWRTEAIGVSMEEEAP